MMNTKINTKTWNDHQQNAPVSASKREMTASATDESQILENKDMGQVLNEIADPKYVDPAKMRKPQGKLDKDAFLKLMLTQMKYQDPMNPMQSHEMAAQLAQFSSLEQLSNINDSIKGLKKSQDPMANYQALNFIGKTISSDTEKILRGKGDTNHDLRFQLNQAAKEVQIKIKDESGNVIKIVKGTNLKRGENKLVWNGTKEDGYPAYAGNYSFSVEGQAENGTKVVGRTSFSGTVTGLNFSAEGPVLMIGDQKVRLSDVKKIEDQGQKDAQVAREAAPALAAATVPGTAPTPEQLTAMLNQARQQMPAAPSSAAAPGSQSPGAAALGMIASPQQSKPKIELLTPKKQKPKSSEIDISAGAQEKPKGNMGNVPMSDTLRNMIAKETS